MTSIEPYQLTAVRYATNEAATRGSHFIDNDPDPDRPEPMDFFVWLATNGRRTVLIDTGYSAATAARRGRAHARQPSAGLQQIGVDPASVQDVVITHMHYDHAGTIDDYPRAHLHLQEKEMHFVTGIPMMDPEVRYLFELDDLVNVTSRLYTDRLTLHDGDAEIAPGISLHLVEGHTPGMQVVRVYTKRGWVVLASDASHYYENLETARPFRVVHDVAKTHEAYRTIQGLAETPAHFIPGHDPLVMQRYPAVSPELEGVAVSLDVMPST